MRLIIQSRKRVVRVKCLCVCEFAHRRKEQSISRLMHVYNWRAAHVCKRWSHIIACSTPSESAAAADHLSILLRASDSYLSRRSGALDAPAEVMGRSRPVLQTFIRHALFSTPPRAPAEINTPDTYTLMRRLCMWSAGNLKPRLPSINAGFRAKSAMGNCLFRSREQQFLLHSCVKIIRRQCKKTGKRGGNWCNYRTRLCRLVVGLWEYTTSLFSWN